MSKKLFEFKSNVLRRFFKVLATDVVANDLPQMFNRDGEPHFPLYWQFDPTRFKLSNEDLSLPYGEGRQGYLGAAIGLIGCTSHSVSPLNERSPRHLGR